MRGAQGDIALLFEVLPYLLEAIRHFSSVRYRVLKDFMQASWGIDAQQNMAGEPYGKHEPPDFSQNHAESHFLASNLVLDIS